MLSRGRIGSIIAGLGFILPGFILMFISAVLYQLFGLKYLPVLASFTAIQPCVCAMMFRAVHKLGSHSLSTNWLLVLGVLGAIQTVVGFNFVITLVVAGIVHTLVTIENKRARIAGIIASVVLITLSFILYAVWTLYVPQNWSLGSGFSFLSAPTWYNIFILGLLAGLLTFGGAYTAIRKYSIVCLFLPLKKLLFNSTLLFKVNGSPTHNSWTELQLAQFFLVHWLFLLHLLVTLVEAGMVHF